MSNDSTIDKMVTLGSDVNSSYNSMKDSNMSLYDTNDDTMNKIVNAINANLAELNLIQNKNNVINNVNQGALLKYEKLLKMENDKLKKQLKELEIIQSSISNKERLLDQTDSIASDKDLNIKVLITSIVLGLLLLTVIILYGYNYIVFTQFIVFLFIIFILYIVLVLYSYNVFYLKDAFVLVFNDTEEKIKNSVTHFDQAAENLYINTKEYLRKEWISNNCLCPPSMQEEEDNTMYDKEANVYTKEVPGYYYNDGTSPSQLIYTTANNDSNEKIDWIDYSSNGHTQYNPQTNKTTYTNNNYYNYNSNDPQINQLKNLDNLNDLVNDTTSTANL
jgi:hypothetical protein